jgi:hypothetical protein
MDVSELTNMLNSSLVLDPVLAVAVIFIFIVFRFGFPDNIKVVELKSSHAPVRDLHLIMVYPCLNKILLRKSDFNKEVFPGFTVYFNFAFINSG